MSIIDAAALVECSQQTDDLLRASGDVTGP